MRHFFSLPEEDFFRPPRISNHFSSFNEYEAEHFSPSWLLPIWPTSHLQQLFWRSPLCVSFLARMSRRKREWIAFNDGSRLEKKMEKISFRDFRNRTQNAFLYLVVKAKTFFYCTFVFSSPILFPVEKKGEEKFVLTNRLLQSLYGKATNSIRVMPCSKGRVRSQRGGQWLPIPRDKEWAINKLRGEEIWPTFCLEFWFWHLSRFGFHHPPLWIENKAVSVILWTASILIKHPLKSFVNKNFSQGDQNFSWKSLFAVKPIYASLSAK